MRQEKTAGVIIYYIEKEPKFLLLKYPTYWGFVKGLIEENETEEETALRELKEEANISNLKIIEGFSYSQEWFFKLNNETIKKNATFFLAEITKEEAKNVQISWEHQDFSFCTYQEALEKMRVKNNKEMLTAAFTFIKERNKQKTLF